MSLLYHAAWGRRVTILVRRGECFSKIVDKAVTYWSHSSAICVDSALCSDCSWQASFESGSLIGYLCFNETVSVTDTTEPITTQHSMRSKKPALFASLERNSVPSARVVVPEIFVALIFSLSLFFFLIFKSCDWDLFYSLKRIDSIWTFVVTGNRSKLWVLVSSA